MSILDQVWGKKGLQFLYRRLYSFALKGLNYGRASDYLYNGEIALIRQVRSMVASRSCVIFDVGANQGAFTRRVMEEWLGMNYKVYAFEPSARTFALLKESVDTSGFVYLFNIGFGQEPGTATLYTNEEGSGLASLYPRDLSHRHIDFSQHETVELSTLDIFCALYQIEQIDFLKLDVEGHELSVLKGAERMLREGRIKIIQFEFGGCNIDSRTFFRDYFSFFHKDYKLHRVLQDGLEPLEEYSERLEVFQSANYVAVRRETF